MSLTDVLGISIAFITLILLVSIFVTALVQTAQGLLRLRARNLLKGLAAILVNSRFPTDDHPASAQDIADAKRDAMKVLNTRVLTPGRVRPATGKYAEVRNKHFGVDSFIRYFFVGPHVLD